MAFETLWYHTNLPTEIVQILEKDLINFEDDFKPSEIGTSLNKNLNKNIRNSKNVWIHSNHWIAGFIWHYIMKANRENFLYDLTCIDSESLQYTRYEEGQYYHWHKDDYISSSYKPKNALTMGVNDPKDKLSVHNEYVRKLSFALQLSDPEEYRGGEVQFMDSFGGTYFMPKQKGTIAFFDSRVPHRVRKIKSGVRKSLVGWVIGPRWK